MIVLNSWLLPGAVGLTTLYCEWAVSIYPLLWYARKIPDFAHPTLFAYHFLVDAVSKFNVQVPDFLSMLTANIGKEVYSKAEIDLFHMHGAPCMNGHSWKGTRFTKNTLCSLNHLHGWPSRHRVELLKQDLSTLAGDRAWRVWLHSYCEDHFSDSLQFPRPRYIRSTIRRNSTISYSTGGRATYRSTRCVK